MRHLTLRSLRRHLLGYSEHDCDRAWGILLDATGRNEHAAAARWNVLELAVDHWFEWPDVVVGVQALVSVLAVERRASASTMHWQCERLREAHCRRAEPHRRSPAFPIPTVRQLASIVAAL